MLDAPTAPRAMATGPTVSIADIAAATEIIEHAAVRKHPAETRLGPDFRGYFGARFTELESSFTIRMYTLRDVVLDTDAMILLHDGMPIRETVFHLRPDQDKTPALDLSRLVRLDPGPDYIVGVNNLHHRYMHWMMQCLPAIDHCLQRTAGRDRRLLLPQLNDWQAETLVLLNAWHLPATTLLPGRQYAIPSACYAEFLNGSAIFGASYKRIETARRLAAAAPRLSATPRILHVPNRNPYYGRITNAAEAQSLLESRGARTIAADRHDVARRIGLFRQADAIIGPLGGDLVDVMFCQPDALFWEWMPHNLLHQAANQIARSADLAYWGDLLQPDPGVERGLRYDLDRLAGGLDHLLSRSRPALARTEPPIRLGMPAPELLLEFESIGDNCEFGLLQRYWNVEPLGLLRLAAFNVPPPLRAARLAAALRRRFDGIGEPASIRHWFVNQPPPREFMVEEALYGLQSHSGVRENEVEAGAIAERECMRMRFLQPKLMEDLAVGEKICVWKSTDGATLQDVMPILEALRELGPNRLLWAVDADEELGAGMVRQLDHDLVKGALAPDPLHGRPGEIAADESIWDERRLSWLRVCQSAYGIFRAAGLSGTDA